jgi:hypothetical protein
MNKKLIHNAILINILLASTSLFTEGGKKHVRFGISTEEMLKHMKTETKNNQTLTNPQQTEVPKSDAIGKGYFSISDCMNLSYQGVDYPAKRNQKPQFPKQLNTIDENNEYSNEYSNDDGTKNNDQNPNPINFYESIVKILLNIRHGAQFNEIKQENFVRTDMTKSVPTCITDLMRQINEVTTLRNYKIIDQISKIVNELAKEQMQLIREFCINYKKQLTERNENPIKRFELNNPDEITVQYQQTKLRNNLMQRILRKYIEYSMNDLGLSLKKYFQSNDWTRGGMNSQTALIISNAINMILENLNNCLKERYPDIRLTNFENFEHNRFNNRFEYYSKYKIGDLKFISKVSEAFQSNIYILKDYMNQDYMNQKKLMRYLLKKSSYSEIILIIVENFINHIIKKVKDTDKKVINISEILTEIRKSGIKNVLGRIQINKLEENPITLLEDFVYDGNPIDNNEANEDLIFIQTNIKNLNEIDQEINPGEITDSTGDTSSSSFESNLPVTENQFISFLLNITTEIVSSTLTIEEEKQILPDCIKSLEKYLLSLNEPKEEIIEESKFQ